MALDDKKYVGLAENASQLHQMGAKDREEKEAKKGLTDLLGFDTSGMPTEDVMKIVTGRENQYAGFLYDSTVENIDEILGKLISANPKLDLLFNVALRMPYETVESISPDTAKVHKKYQTAVMNLQKAKNDPQLIEKLRQELLSKYSSDSVLVEAFRDISLQGVLQAYANGIVNDAETKFKAAFKGKDNKYDSELVSNYIKLMLVNATEEQRFDVSNPIAATYSKVK